MTGTVDSLTSSAVSPHVHEHPEPHRLWQQPHIVGHVGWQCPYPDGVDGYGRVRLDTGDCARERDAGTDERSLR